MPNINGRILALAIQAVDFKIADLEQTMDSLPADERSELETLLLSYINAAEALKRTYQEALAESDNLSPYEKLVRSES